MPGLATLDHAVGDHRLAHLEQRRQRARRPTEITPLMSPCRASSFCCQRYRVAAARHRDHARAAHDLGFALEAGDREDRQSPTSTRRELPSLRLR